jgi:AcrR family transcriptional regulator
MSPTSHLDGCARRSPTQQRGLERVSKLLAAAVDEFAAVGYEAATMEAIARRAKSPIGSLYQFFPNKQAIARTLRARQIEHIAALWTELGQDPECRSIDCFVARFMNVMAAFVASHPAFLPLLDAPPSTLPPGARDRLRGLLAELLRVLEPRPSPVGRRQCAIVILGVNKALMGLYAEASARDRTWIKKDYGTLLRSYLSAHVRTSTRKPRRA